MKKIFLIIFFIFLYISGLKIKIGDKIHDLPAPEVRQAYYSYSYLYPLDFVSQAFYPSFKLHSAGNFEGAYKNFEALAQSGHENEANVAKYMLAIMNLFGQGVEKNKDKAEQLFNELTHVENRDIALLSTFFSRNLQKFVTLDRDFFAKGHFAVSAMEKYDDILKALESIIEKERNGSIRDGSIGDGGLRGLLQYQLGLLEIFSGGYSAGLELLLQVLSEWEKLPQGEREKYTSIIALINVIIGEMYYRGIGVQANNEKAQRYLSRAAKQSVNPIVAIGARELLGEMAFNHIYAIVKKVVKGTVLFKSIRLMKNIAGQDINRFAKKLSQAFLVEHNIDTILQTNEKSVRAWLVT